MVKMLWFGIKKANGQIEARRYTGAHNIEEAKNDAFVTEWTDPYQAIGRSAATEMAIQKLKSTA